jgi:hypothetical protein
MSTINHNLINSEIIDSITINKINKINEIMNYLEKNWTIKKNNNHYILKKENCIKCILFSNYEKAVNLINKNNTLEKDNCIYIFIYNTLENGWTIKKNKSKYIFKKKHQGKKEYFSKNFLNDFIVENIHNN